MWRPTGNSGWAAARTSKGLILLTLGTGVGGGIIVDGVVVEGVNSFGAECGHIIVDSRPDARLCVWGGGRGELEAYASASAVAARAEELLADGRPSSLQAARGGGRDVVHADARRKRPRQGMRCRWK